MSWTLTPHVGAARERRLRSGRLSAAIALVIYAGWLGGVRGDERATQILNDLAQLAAPIAAATAAWFAARRHHGRSRRGWRLIAAASLAWAAGQAVWCWYEIGLGRNTPFPSLADIGYLGFVPLVVGGIASFLPGRRRGAPMGVGLDLVLVTVPLAALAWVLVLRPAFSEAPLQDALALVYPVADAAIVAALVLVRSRSAEGLPLSVFTLLAGGLLMLGAADASFAYLTAVHGYATGALSDIGWVAGFVLIALAGLSADDIPPDGPVRTDDQRVNWVLAVPGGAAAAVSLGRLATGADTDAVLAWSMAVVLVVLLARELIAFRAQSQPAPARATVDGLTGLPTRVHLEALMLDPGSRAPSGLVIVEVTGLDVVNAGLGLRSGDRVLTQLAHRLVRRLPDVHMVARIGDHEFAVATEATDVDGVAGTVGAAASEQFSIDGRRVFLGATIGVASSVAGGTTDLLREAGTALASGRRTGGSEVKTFTPIMQEVARNRIDIESDLRVALDRGQFELHYQPVLDTRTREITGAEALLRWNHPHRGLLMPAAFIHVAEETNLIAAIGRWVASEALHHTREWQRRNGSFRIHINVSARQFADSTLPDQMAQALGDSGLAPGTVVVEITESVLMEDHARTVRQLAAFQALGLRLAIDDFGTGYSSLSYLKRFPVDTLKIDRSFIEDIATDARDAALVNGICTIGASLGIAIVAEGVETIEQHRALEGIGCGFVQGYLYSVPVPAEELTALLARPTADAASRSGACGSVVSPVEEPTLRTCR